MTFKTADLCDEFSEHLQIAEQGLRNFGGKKSFSGKIVTLKLFEDNSLVREALENDGTGQVLVVDGGASLRCALLGDILAGKAVKNNWDGIIINGCIRDSADIVLMDIGVKALATHPLKSVKKGAGESGVPVTFSGVIFRPGEFIYADEDGVIVSSKKLI
ncbi:MAG TPA: putative 4-hydroxy-4-methyl-2-oxoglutarate aldolase [Chromatiales bacterium]|nr:putative 4-hydroxy-4-methyl-2-oxoglutarate aldolase [Thiotrichales bacterium]HIP69215.1 putative 4-hydroxy-4-methyl-2-oxoglutarate aldolase [Chromatiales bacterium]